MASPNLVVSTSIAIKDKAASVASFGTIGIFAKSPSVNPLTYDVGSDGLAAMITDGFTAGSAAYVIAQTIAAQNPTVTQIKVFPRALQNAQDYKVTPSDLGASRTHSITIVGTGGVEVTASFTADETPTVPDIVAGLVAALGVAAPVGVTVTAVGGVGTETHFTLAPTVAGTRFYIRSATRGLLIEDTSIDAGIGTDLAAGLLADPDFYGVLIDSTSAAEITAAAAWAASNLRLFAGTSLDSAIVAAGSLDVASTVKATKNNRAVIAFGRDGFARVGDAIMARQFSRAPGSSTWALKELGAVTVDDLTAGEIGYARGKNALVYVPISGLNLTLDGKTVGGRFADVTRDIDWLNSNLQAAAITALAQVEKAPYNDLGVALVENSMRTVLDTAVSAGMIENGYDVVPPIPEAQLLVDRAARIMGAFKWSGVLSGALHSTSIDGTLSV